MTQRERAEQLRGLIRVAAAAENVVETRRTAGDLDFAIDELDTQLRDYLAAFDLQE